MRILITILFLHTALLCTAQEWWFWPKYTLGQKAANYPGNRISAPEENRPLIVAATIPLIFHGEEPTERLTNFVAPSQMPHGPFSIEMWMVNHVNQPIGSIVTFKPKFGNEEPDWLLGIYGKDIVYSLKTKNSPFAQLITKEIQKKGFKKYWNYLVATFDEKKMSLHLNGELIGELPGEGRANIDRDTYQIEVAAYHRHEPYMDLGNHLKMVRLENFALNAEQVSERYKQLNGLVEEGKLFPGVFHFNAGPYLNNVKATSIDIIFEVDRPADFVIKYGKQLPLDKKIELQLAKIEREVKTSGGNIYKVTLKDLDPASAYFYNVIASSRDGHTMESGVLTFSTAIKERDSYTFGVIGDTEARPHINDRISKLLWDERPNLVLLVGDLTDGGVKDHKFEWNYEYFQGITQLASRVPVFPVPGNGEDDLYWYNQYHSLPTEDGYYSFKYGNAEFFMLNSNKPSAFSPGGKQYVWLEENLKRSTAVWKFVCHHHAPYSADDDDYGDSWKGASASGDLAIRKIVPLYEKYQVDMVFFGHLHTYQRTLPIKNNMVDRQNGVTYVQGGGGGGNLEDFAPSRAWFSAKTYRGHHYFIVTVAGNELNFKMYDMEGSLKDYLDLKK